MVPNSLETLSKSCNGGNRLKGLIQKPLAWSSKHSTTQASTLGWFSTCYFCFHLYFFSLVLRSFLGTHILVLWFLVAFSPTDLLSTNLSYLIFTSLVLLDTSCMSYLWILRALLFVQTFPTSIFASSPIYCCYFFASYSCINTTLYSLCSFGLCFYKCILSPKPYISLRTKLGPWNFLLSPFLTQCWDRPPHFES